MKPEQQDTSTSLSHELDNLESRIRRLYYMKMDDRHFTLVDDAIDKIPYHPRWDNGLPRIITTKKKQYTAIIIDKCYIGAIDEYDKYNRLDTDIITASSLLELLKSVHL